MGDDLEKQSGYYDTPWQWENIKANQERIALIWGTQDPYIPQEEFEYIAEQLRPTCIKIQEGTHFNDRDELPELLTYIRQTYI